VCFLIQSIFSEETPEGTFAASKLDQILLNGSGIVMVKRKMA
jgi:hypothetical protein